MTRRKLPTGIQTFRKLREDDCYDVDKTAFIAGRPACSRNGRSAPTK